MVEEGEGRGTQFRLVFDTDIFPEQPVRSTLRASLLEAAHLLPGIRISFCGERFHAPGGLLDLLPLYTPHSFVAWPRQRAHHKWEDNRLRVEIAVCGVADRADTVWRSWVNCGGTLVGSHVEGVRRAFEAVGWIPEVALVHVVFEEPEYAGPTHERLDVPWVEDAIAAELQRRLGARPDGVQKPQGRQAPTDEDP